MQSLSSCFTKICFHKERFVQKFLVQKVPLQKSLFLYKKSPKKLLSQKALSNIPLHKYSLSKKLVQKTFSKNLHRYFSVLKLVKEYISMRTSGRNRFRWVICQPLSTGSHNGSFNLRWLWNAERALA